ncbi:tetratricopeptide repeat protein [Herbivorax sp. ANBcel31]|uniref:tetratricopeptide repeat protein n=1 Tax=Herbivorax sp. ANBcel31 TaxID=3069754 RepID=UPI0027B75864|nr:tetratricopeptide repeat protein [Herbivorax sp. ANBcel31]MDQ2087396.1 tetratricopeptide repeat protein [Herbivorax sp. ANBcel31]
MDFSKELSNYPPLDLDKLSESDKSMPDKIRNSIVLYNKALEDFKSKSEDIAIIELKKAISLNPEFQEAINLLGVFYTYVGDYENASATFKKVIDKEKNCVKAIEYLKEVNPEYQFPFETLQDAKGTKLAKQSNKSKKKKTKKAKENGLNDKIINFEEFGISDVIKIGAGFIIGGILVFVLTLSIYSIRDNDNEAKTDENQQLQTIDEEQEAYKEKFYKLNEEYSNLSKELEEFKQESQHYLNNYRLIEAEELLEDERYEEAADKLVLLKDANFGEREQQKFNRLYDEVIDTAAWRAFEEGRDLLQDERYEEALEKLNKVELYVDRWEHSHYNLFYIGICHENLNDSQEALKFYNKAVERYPDTHGASLSRERISEIKSAF